MCTVDVLVLAGGGGRDWRLEMDGSGGEADPRSVSSAGTLYVQSSSSSKHFMCGNEQGIRNDISLFITYLAATFT